MILNPEKYHTFGNWKHLKSIEKAIADKKLKEMGCELVRHAGDHDWYTNPKTKQSQPVPRHKEINEDLKKSLFEIDFGISVNLLICDYNMIHQKM